MAKTLAERAAQAANTSQEPAKSFAGSSGRKYTAKSGRKINEERKKCNIMLFGDGGTGKTFMVVGLLQAGLKVFGIGTDFGNNGFITIYNYFYDHPEEAHLLDNFIEITLDADGLMEFARRPEDVVIELADGTKTNIYDFNPDVIFWDGVSSWQMTELEARICGLNDFLREDSDFKDWRSTQNGTLFPMMRIMKLEGKDGKPWSKIMTFASEKSPKYEKTEFKDAKGAPVRAVVSGSNKNGPMLHTKVRDLSIFGFDLCMETSVQDLGNKKTFYYTSNSSEKLVKSRGWNLPDTPINVTDENFWLKYIAPRIAGKQAETSTDAVAST